MIAETETGPNMPNSLLLKYLEILLTLTRRSMGENHPDTKTENILQQFLNLVEQHYTKKLSVTEYADMMAVSYRQLSRICNSILNKSPLSVVHQRINVEAKRELLYSREPIKEIAFKLGFEDASHFTNFFKKQNNNQSPESFREYMSEIFRR